MFAKTGLSLIAAAGVAVGVVGMTMGGASGASLSCAPAHASANSQRSASSSNDSTSAGSRGSSANVDTSGENAHPTDPSGVTDPTGTDGTGVALPADPTTIDGGATIPGSDGSSTTDPSGSSSNGSDRPLLHLSENTNPTNAAGSSLSPTGTDVVGRSTNISGLNIFGHVNQGR